MAHLLEHPVAIGAPGVEAGADEGAHALERLVDASGVGVRQRTCERTAAARRADGRMSAEREGHGLFTLHI